MSLLQRAQQAPADPILGLTEAFRKDERDDKVNLGVGVYLDETGTLPLMSAVREAQQRYIVHGKSHGYLPIDGLPEYREQMRTLAFGPDADLSRVATIQSLSGTGALKVGAELIHQLAPETTILISDPSWENHRALFTRAGFAVETYRYYDAERRGVDFDGMLESLRAAKAGAVVVLHACCHNPTGYDLSDGQWEQVVDLIAERELFAFVDMAYQGFAAGPEQDRALVGKLMDRGVAFMLATSASKNFGLYGQRTGALSVVSADADEAARVLSQLKIIARTSYSNPPAFGAHVVASILSDDELRSLWDDELAHMRTRIASLRQQLVEGLEAAGVSDMGFIAQQCGMFSYSGLTKEQMVRLREEFGIYGTDSGRLCVAALNAGNLQQVAAAIAAVRG